MNIQHHKWLLPPVVLAVMPFLFFTGGTYVARIFTLFLMFAVLAMALNIVFGHTDQLLLFTGGVVGLGAYTTLITANAIGISMWATVLLGGVFAGAFGAFTCWVAARRRMGIIVISILTLALQLALIEAYFGFSDLTGGDTGMRTPQTELVGSLEAMGIPKLTFLYYAFLVMLALVLLLYQYLMKSHYGLAFDVIRQDELAAEAAGVAVVRYKTIAGFISTFIMGLVGPFYAQIEGFVFPSMFSFPVIDVLVLIILVVGGLRTMYGPIAGAALLVYVNEQLQAAQQYRRMVFGLLLMILFLYFREGIVLFVDEYLEDRFEYRDRLAGITRRD